MITQKIIFSHWRDEPIESWDTTTLLIVLLILSRKLDATMLGEWRDRVSVLEHKTFKDFYEFLGKQATYLENFVADDRQQRLTNNQ